MGKIQLCLYCIALALISTGVGEGIQKKIKFEIKALKPFHTAYECDLLDFEAAYVSCNRQPIDNWVQNQTYCHVPGNGTILEYQCVEGDWKLSTGTDYHLRERRFIGWIIGLFVALAVVVVITYCSISGCTTKAANENKPPKFTSCKPSDIQEVYTAGKGKKEVKVTWREPEASGDSKIEPLKERNGYESGQYFKGMSGSGKKYRISYEARDKKGLIATCNFHFTVKYLTCGTPPHIDYGSISKSDETIYGETRSYKCYTGYEIIGHSTVTCQQNETWSLLPKCQKKKCKPPFKIRNGNIRCDDGHSYGDLCNVKCYKRLTLKQPRPMICNAYGTWTVSASEVRCVDDVAPEIKCKERQEFYLDFSRPASLINWEEPTATDNLDKMPSIKQQHPQRSQNQSLSEGLHYVKYKATDKAGNSDRRSSCIITLDVRVMMCSFGPTDALDNPRFMMKNCSYPNTNYPKSFYSGVSCQLWCDLNLPLNGSDVLTCERDGEKNSAVWKSGSENKPFCEVVQCPALDPPANGAFTTDSVNARPLHVMFCKEGYDIPSVGSAFQGRLSCQDSGKWYPLEEFPDCIVSTLPWLSLPAELYYKGDCNDSKTKEKIKHQVLKYLAGVKEDVDKSICLDANTCKIENVNVFCGETSKRKRRSGAKNIFKRQTGYALVRWNIKILFDNGNTSVMEKYVQLLGVLSSIKNKIQEDVNNGKLDIPGFTLSSDAFQTDRNPGLGCDSGHTVDYGSLKCKPCPRGTYLNSSSTQCEFCNVGEYMDHDGASVCTKCPEGYSTLKTGSKDLANCIKLCSPGYFSSSLMEPCSSCPVGTYQPFEGQEKCLICPFGTATAITASTSVNKCDFFDILVDQLSQKTDIGMFRANGTRAISLSVWLKLQSETNPELSLHMSDTESNDFFSVSVSNLVYVGFDTSSVVNTNTSLSPEHWTHLMGTIDVAKNALEVYINGKLTVNESGRLPDPSRFITSGTVQMSSRKGGIYMSSLFVYDRVFSSDDKAGLSEACAVAPSDEIFSMTNILPSIGQGISVIVPTTCDPVDECSSKPCGNHKCVNLIAGFECMCHGGMTGKLCDIHPDYCQGHECVHGNCIPGNGTYTCNCTDGYTGIFCDTPPVNGEWSFWSEWNRCDVTCGGGTRSRTRHCNNPPPGFMGEDCEGNSTDTESCNDELCPTCPKLNRRFGTIVTCYHNDSENLKECNMTCMPGMDLTNGQNAFKKYTCGLSTNYEWMPINKFPECVKVTRPDIFGTKASMSYGTLIPDSDKPAVASSVERKLSSGIGCVESGLCNLTSLVTNRSRKRSTSSTLTLHFSIELKEVGDLGIADYLDSGTETPALSELLQALGAINDAVEFIQNNTESLFQANVNGVDYVPESNSSNFALIVTCPVGQAGAGGLCGTCPAGTKFVDMACLDCEVGTYQPSTGQTTCLTCPAGYSTLTNGAADKSECLKLCSPGHYSSSSMEECNACPFGSYQPLEGQRECLSCPFGTATNKSASTSVKECTFFDIYIGQISQKTNIGWFDANESSSLSLSVWLKLQSGKSQINPDMSINITDSGFYNIISLSVNDFVNVGFGTSYAVSTNTTLSSERWTHLICTIDVAQQAVGFSVNGESVVNETSSFQDPSPSISFGKVQIRSNAEGIYISGLAVYDRIFSIDDKAAMSQACTVVPSDEIFSMTNILPHIGQGISIITPTTCDPVDECSSKPCGNHKCLNLVGSFKCICHGEMTGKLCDEPPDYCKGHECVQGDCIPGKGTYTCNCTDGYTGLFCNTPPVNGKWSNWSEWNRCDVMCGGGTRSRTRTCNNPPPGFMGRNCDGNNTDTESCNEKKCEIISDKLTTADALTTSDALTTTETLTNADMLTTPDRLTTSDRLTTTETLTSSDRLTTTETLTTSDRLTTSDALTTTDTLTNADALTIPDRLTSSDALTTTDTLTNADALTIPDRLTTSDALTTTDTLTNADALTTSDRLTSSDALTTTETLTNADTLTTPDRLTSSDALTTTDTLTNADMLTTAGTRTTKQSDDNSSKDVEKPKLNRILLIMVIVVSSGTIVVTVALKKKIISRQITLETTSPDGAAPSSIDKTNPSSVDTTDPSSIDTARVFFNPRYKKDIIPSIPLLNSSMEPTFQEESPVHSGHAVDQATESTTVS